MDVLFVIRNLSTNTDEDGRAMTPRATAICFWAAGLLGGGVTVGAWRVRRQLAPLLPPDDDDDPVKQALRASSPWH